MISHTQAQLDALKGPHQVNYLAAFTIGGSNYAVTTGDDSITWDGYLFQPGYMNEFDDIEITSEPKVNSVSVDIKDHDNTFVALMLGGGWMNSPCTIYKHFSNDAGLIMVKVAFQGLLSDYKYEPEKNTITLGVESVWADWEKTAGIKTNPSSYQRYYSSTGFRHASNAMKKVYWGKDAPVSRTPTGTGGGGTVGSRHELTPSEP